MSGPKYEQITVKLVGEDGNAVAILVRVRRALQRARVTPTEVQSFMDEAMSGDYDHLLATVSRWVTVR